MPSRIGVSGGVGMAGRPAAWSAFDEVHEHFLVALAGGRREVVQPFDLLGAQLDTVMWGKLNCV